MAGTNIALTNSINDLTWEIESLERDLEELVSSIPVPGTPEYLTADRGVLAASSMQVRLDREYLEQKRRDLARLESARRRAA